MDSNPKLGINSYTPELPVEVVSYMTLYIFYQAKKICLFLPLCTFMLKGIILINIRLRMFYTFFLNLYFFSTCWQSKSIFLI